MRAVLLWMCAAAVLAQPSRLWAQPNQIWRQELLGLPANPTGATVQDVDRFVQNVQLATPYFTTIAPGDFEANREMVRRMWTYVMALEMMAGKNPALRPLALRVRGAMNTFPIGYGMVQPRGGAQAAGREQKAAGPPFAMSAPHVGGAPAELTARYDSTAPHAAVVWQNAETLRQSLVARGMSLNAQTAASLNRLQVAMDNAVRALQSRNWNEANESLDRAGGEIEKIGKVVGK